MRVCVDEDVDEGTTSLSVQTSVPSTISLAGPPAWQSSAQTPVLRAGLQDAQQLRIERKQWVTVSPADRVSEICHIVLQAQPLFWTPAICCYSL